MKTWWLENRFLNFLMLENRGRGIECLKIFPKNVKTCGSFSKMKIRHEAAKIF